jgi:hypothetical protein
MARKRVLVALPPDAYRRLADLAEEEERGVDQQASLMLKRLLCREGDRLDDSLVEEADRRDQDPGQRLPTPSAHRGEGGLSS